MDEVVREHRLQVGHCPGSVVSTYKCIREIASGGHCPGSVVSTYKCIREIASGGHCSGSVVREMISIATLKAKWIFLFLSFLAIAMKAYFGTDAFDFRAGESSDCPVFPFR